MGALIAALALSFLGAGGTILGVALGSAAATLGSAIAFHSLERGHARVRKIVDSVASPGAVLVSPFPEPAIAVDPDLDANPGVRRASPAPPPLHGRGSKSPRRWSVPVVIIVVFLVSIGIVTGVELLAGRPLSSVIGGTPSARQTSVGDLFRPGTTTTTSTTTSTSTVEPVPPVQPTTSSSAPATTTTSATTSTTSTTTIPSSTTTQP